MSLTCDYDTLDSGTLCRMPIPVAPRRGISCEELCSNRDDCFGFKANDDGDICFIRTKELSVASSNTILVDAIGSCHIKIQDSCRTVDSRNLEECRGACILDLLLVIPGFIIYAIIGFFVLCFLCCLPCICIEMCRPSATQRRIADARAKAIEERNEHPSDIDTDHHSINEAMKQDMEDLIEVEMTSNSGKALGTEHSIPPTKAHEVSEDIERNAIPNDRSVSSISRHFSS